MDKDQLLELYKSVIEEYRFEVNLSWESVKFYTTLNIGILGFGVSILGLQLLSPKWIVIPIFIIGILLSYLAIRTRQQYRKYYLNTILIKKKIENQLNLMDLAISPTEEIDEPCRGLHDKEEWIKNHMRPKGTVTFYHYSVFWGFIGAYVLGIIISIFFV